MTSQAKMQGIEHSRMNMHRSSVFEIPTGFRRSTFCGSSITSFAEPSEEYGPKGPSKVLLIQSLSHFSVVNMAKGYVNNAMRLIIRTH